MADVRDRQQRLVAELLRTFPGTDSGHYNERSVQADRVLQALTPGDSRIWIVDQLGHVKASRGQLETASEIDNDSSGWRGLLDAVQILASKTLPGIPLGPTRGFDPDNHPQSPGRLAATGAGGLCRSSDPALTAWTRKPATPSIRSAGGAGLHEFYKADFAVSICRNMGVDSGSCRFFRATKPLAK